MTVLTAPMEPQATSSESSRLSHLLNATKRLSADLQSLFDALFLKGLTTEQACAALQLTPEVMEVRRQTMLRVLRSAAA